MDNYKHNAFVIRTPVKETIAMLVISGVLEIGAIYIAVFLPDYRIASIVFAVLFTPLILFLASGMILFQVQINGICLSVRTMTGKRFSFTCGEIYKIVCERRGSIKYGASYYDIEIYTDENVTNTNMVIVSHGREGFSRLAEYLLTQLNTGEISETAASDSCRKELRRYAKGEIFGRKKRDREA